MNLEKSLNLSMRLEKETKAGAGGQDAKNLLEAADGIKLLDNAEMAEFGGGDLRVSIGPGRCNLLEDY